MTIISTNIKQAADLLRQDEVVAIPTETVYGLAGNIYSEIAIKKIFNVKQRPFFNPLIIHITSVEKIYEVVAEFPEKAQQLAKAFWPGSLTLILKKKTTIPDLITAGKDTVAVRVPNHPVTLSLLAQLEFPLAAPSANPFSKISPTKAKHVANYFKHEIPMVLEGGSCENGIESTIIGFENDKVVVYRLGSISIEEIEVVVGNVQVKNSKETAPNAPGMLAKHYSPNTKTYLVDNAQAFISTIKGKKIGVLVFDKPAKVEGATEVVVLSENGDLKEAAAKLYDSLHHLDNAALDSIVIQRFPDYGLGKSINDRLERAAKQ